MWGRALRTGAPDPTAVTEPITIHRGLFLLRRLDIDMQIAQLPHGYRCRRFGHEAGAFRGLGEGDDITDTRSAAENRIQPIEPERDASVGRGAVSESIQHIAEA